jgi:adenylosuccinate lyase
MRNHGVCLGYAVVGYKSLIKGLDKISPNYDVLLTDLENVYIELILALGSIG